MKRKIKLLSTLLILGTISIPFITNKPSNNVAVAFAEEESSLSSEFEKVIYTYENENGTIIITLISETICNIELNSNNEQLEYTMSYSLIGNLLTVYNEFGKATFEVDGTNITNLLSIDKYDTENTETEEKEETNNNQILDNWNKWRETYIEPLLTGVSLSTIVSTILTIFFAIKNKKLNVQNKELNTQVQSQVQETLKLIADFIEESKKILHSVTDQNDLVNNLSNSFASSVEEINKQLTTLYEATAKSEAVKNLLVIMSSIISKLANSSREALKIGISEDINKLADEAKKIK